MAVESVPFAISPYHLNKAGGQDLIDYSTKAGLAHFEAATKPLGEEGSKGYELIPAHSHSLVAALTRRAQIMGWSEPKGILWVPDATGKELNMLTSHGMLTKTDITSKEEVTLAGKTRKAQDTFLRCHCLINSLSKKKPGRW